ncbi:hypothetical protein [Adhaeribacter soli]|uniref:Uncharacterized protein n=1 Tax=Adhaeribacter soli TaxID=2607655 RepID=A0A5N1ISH6_9BACT|nr:hypothetical protein [Adhaeribacter soli]KAA9332871.1 hypothetical protein F0P94_12825 [Adhaeribacter soli]
MGFLKTFVSVVIVCFSFALNSLGQKVEIKQDSTFFQTYPDGYKIEVIRHKVKVNNQPYVIIYEYLQKQLLNPKDKVKTRYSIYEIKNLTTPTNPISQTLASIYPNFNYKQLNQKTLERSLIP